MDKRNAMLKQIMVADFAMHETALFLDTHPKNRQALEYYKKMRDRREELAEQYRREFGPLTYYEVTGNTWDWTDKPWPWQNSMEG